MAVLKPRTRVIFFRVSEEEFHEIEQACAATGARSVSDFARMAARSLISGRDHNRTEVMIQHLSCIDAYLTRLHARIKQMEGSRLPSDAEAF